jgi:phosphate transport system protein
LIDAPVSEVEQLLQAEGELVLRAVRGVTNALERREVELADEVIAFDDAIDGRYADIAGRIEWLLTGSNGPEMVRTLLAVLHANLHLERMADYCVTIAKLTKLTDGLPRDARLAAGFEEMGTRAEEMIRVALHAFAARDVAAAERLVELDELIDRANRRVVGAVLALAADPSRLEWGLRMITVSRCLERIGDHAVDIGEQTAYLVTGEFREFTDASHRQDAPDRSAS